jgi:hypothetical protein
MTGTLEIKATHNQIGLTIEARRGAGEWVTVQVSRYKVRDAFPSVRQYSTCIRPAQDEAEYFSDLDAKGIQYKRVTSCL